jgi:hypothetical protein
MSADVAAAYLARRRDEHRMRAGWTAEERAAKPVSFETELLALRDDVLDRRLNVKPKGRS